LNASVTNGPLAQGVETPKPKPKRGTTFTTPEETSMSITARLDACVEEHIRRTWFYTSDVTPERARMFVRQHRLNTRQRNSVLKIATATNCPDWDTRMKIIASCAQEILGDHEFGHGKPHYAILEELGVAIGMDIDDIRTAKPVPTTQIAWLAWETLTRNRHWLEGLIANTCAERVNVPGYGEGRIREVGFSGVMREKWQAAFGLSDDELAFWSVHEEADIVHSNLGWQTIAAVAEQLRMEDAVIEACRVNLYVWECYFNGIGDAADAGITNSI
jgi:pyrroloquinoline-quinone synthase